MKGSLVLISLALVWFVHWAWVCVTLLGSYARMLALTPADTSSGQSRRSGPDSPSKLPAELGATGLLTSQLRHILALNGFGFCTSTQPTWPKAHLVISKIKSLPRTTIRLLGWFERMMRSRDDCFQRCCGWCSSSGQWVWRCSVKLGSSPYL